nr:PREDICTED: coactosin-like protein [Equus przewalskii]
MPCLLHSPDVLASPSPSETGFDPEPARAPRSGKHNGAQTDTGPAALTRPGAGRLGLRGRRCRSLGPGSPWRNRRRNGRRAARDGGEERRGLRPDTSPGRAGTYGAARRHGSAVIWVTFKYDGSTIVPGEQGAEYQDFIQQCTDDIRLFAFVRFTTGDAMSKRSKFALITWIGENVSGLQRAKTGTDKTLVKEVVQNFAKEFVISDRKELEEDFIKSELKKAGGANYDAQTE